jgi:hypothetical protein
VEKASSITYTEYVSVASDIRHEMRIHDSVICGLPSCTIFFAKLSKKKMVFGGGVTEYNFFLFALQHLCETFLIPKSERDIIKRYIGIHVQ